MKHLRFKVYELSYGGLFLFLDIANIRIHPKIKILFKSWIQVKCNTEFGIIRTIFKPIK